MKEVFVPTQLVVDLDSEGRGTRFYHLGNHTAIRDDGSIFGQPIRGEAPVNEATAKEFLIADAQARAEECGRLQTELTKANAKIAELTATIASLRASGAGLESTLTYLNQLRSVLVAE